MSQIVQLTSLRPTADLFCSLLRDALKVELQRGQMKLCKPFAKTCYSEFLLASDSDASSSSRLEHEREDGSIIEQEKKPDGEGGHERTYLGGLGLKFRFPGDPKK